MSDSGLTQFGVSQHGAGESRRHGRKAGEVSFRGKRIKYPAIMATHPATTVSWLRAWRFYSRSSAGEPPGWDDRRM